jgi:Asp-tRNA(Asn)/Glu-tRNA(Gln) amidotransferase B subunit
LETAPPVPAGKEQDPSVAAASAALRLAEQASNVGELAPLEQAIAANPGPAADFKAGKAAALNFLKGQVMKLSKGKANPALAGKILEQKLSPHNP